MCAVRYLVPTRYYDTVYGILLGSSSSSWRAIGDEDQERRMERTGGNEKEIKRRIIPKSIESLFSLSARLDQMAAGNGKSANRNTSTDSSRVHYTKEKLFR